MKLKASSLNGDPTHWFYRVKVAWKRDQESPTEKFNIRAIWEKIVGRSHFMPPARWTGVEYTATLYHNSSLFEPVDKRTIHSRQYIKCAFHQSAWKKRRLGSRDWAMNSSKVSGMSRNPSITTTQTRRSDATGDAQLEPQSMHRWSRRLRRLQSKTSLTGGNVLRDKAKLITDNR